MRHNLLPVAAATLMAMTGIAAAQTVATAVTDLNVRSGPGPQYPVVGLLPAGETTELQGCMEGSKWCSLDTPDGTGWVYSDYLQSDFGGTAAIVTQRPSGSIPSATYEESRTAGGAIVGGATGAIAGTIIAGPIGAVAGGVAGAALGGAAGDIATPPEEVRTYVMTNQPEPVYLEGEVVVGASLPPEVVLAEVPDYEYRYVYLNGQPVLVEPDSRRIVYIVR